MFAETKLQRGQCEVVFSGNPKQAHEISLCQVKRKQCGRMAMFIFFPPCCYFLKVSYVRQNVLNNSKQFKLDFYISEENMSGSAGAKLAATLLPVVVKSLLFSC